MNDTLIECGQWDIYSLISNCYKTVSDQKQSYTVYRISYCDSIIFHFLL